MIKIHDTAKVSENCDIEDSVRGSVIEIGAFSNIDSFVKIKPAGGYGDIKLGKDPETGVIILDEDPQWVWIREDASGGYIELRLDKEYGYIINIIQGEFEMYDFELGGQDNDINIEQIQ